MDGGGSLNLIYAEILKKMQFDEWRIETITTQFKGIILGMEARCIERVTLQKRLPRPPRSDLNSALYHTMLA
uniref:Uncharacterized protein n=1 Tax=Triticum urartu TaxID=4572 RepID=A0A8R7QKV7_TRIUA